MGRGLSEAESRTMSQFSDNGEEYRCCCELCHVRTATWVVGVTHGLLLLYLLINSIVLITSVSDDGSGLPGGEGGPDDPLVQGPFITAMIGISLGLIVVLLLLVGVSRKVAGLLLPHFILQLVAIFLLLGLVTCGIVALATNWTVAYRLCNAVAFTAPPLEDTVRLGTAEWIGFVLAFSVYCLLLLLQLPFTFIVWRAYRYLQARREYVKYIQQYSMPLQTGPNRQTMPVPTYYHGNTLYLTAKRASDS